jgi:hypothetical protein
MAGSALRWFEGWMPRRFSREPEMSLPMALAHLTAVRQKPKLSSTHSEYGGSGTPMAGLTVAAEDYNRQLQGAEAVKTYDKMRRGDAQVSATLKVLKLPLLKADWVYVPPEKGDATDQQIADFCNAMVLDDDAMLHPWSFTLRHILLKLDFGFSPLELVWEVGLEGAYKYYRLAPRLPVSVTEWHLDDNGQLVEMLQKVMKGGREQTVAIPAEYLAVFVHEREGDNFNGISALRPAFKHWHYKDQLYSIDGIKHMRFGAGTPKAQNNGGPTDPKTMAAIQTVLEGVQSHERAYIISPNGWDVSIMVPQAQSGTDIMKSVEHHDVMIARNILAPFMNVGQAPNGTRSSTVELIDVFFTALEGVAQEISSDAKRQITAPICDLNFDMTGRSYPTLQARNITRVDMKELGATLEPLVKAGLLTPDDTIEDALRKIIGWPPLAAALRRGDRARPEQQGGATGGRTATTDAVEEELAAAQARQQPNDAALREPTDFERQVLSLTDVPMQLDNAIAHLVRELTRVREQQVRRAARYIRNIDAEQGIAGINDDIPLGYEAEIERLIRASQKAVARYGAEQVRLELKRQGAPVDLRFSESEILAMDATPLGRRDAASLMATSATNTTAQLNAQMRAVISEQALRLRRSGLRGDDLEQRIIQETLPSARRNILQPVRGEVHEAFGVSRTAEALRNRHMILYAMQSTIFDSKRCANCAGVDGETFVMGSERQLSLQPPYVDCQGRENCRCVQLYIYSEPSRN